MTFSECAKVKSMYIIRMINSICQHDNPVYLGIALLMIVLSFFIFISRPYLDFGPNVMSVNFRFRFKLFLKCRMFNLFDYQFSPFIK